MPTRARRSDRYPIPPPRTRPFIRWAYDALAWPFAPRLYPKPIPEPGIFDEPTACIRLNLSWASHVAGCLEVLMQLDAWAGTDEETYFARQEVLKLMSLLQASACGDNLVIRQNPENPCIMEQSTDDGQTWVPVFDFSLCAVPGPPGPPGADGQDGTDGQDGMDGQDGADGSGAAADNQTVSPPDGPNQLDAIFGACMELVDFLYNVGEDWLTTLGSVGDTIQAIEALGTAFAGPFEVAYDSLPFDDFFEALESVGEISLAFYTSNYNITKQRELACDLFCRIRDNGNVFDRPLFNIWVDDLQSVVDLVANPAGFVIGTVSTVLTAFRFRTVALNYALGLNNPDPDWEVLCTDCNAPCTLYDFADGGSQGWTPRVVDGDQLGELVAGGWRENTATGTPDSVQIIAPTFSQDVVSITVRFNGVFDGDNPEVGIYALDDSVIVDNMTAQSEYVFTLPAGVRQFYVFADRDRGGEQQFGTLRLIEIEVCTD